MRLFLLFFWLFVAQSSARGYTAFSSAEFDKATTFFGLLFRGETNTTKLTPYLIELGLTLERKQEIWVISDRKKRGWGVYKIRTTTQSGALISIPHRFFDKGTASIGRKLFKAFPQYHALAISTIHRKIMDMAHTDTTLFNAFHLAFAQRYPEGKIYQLHGFTSSKRRSENLKKADIVVSSTTTRGSFLSRKVKACLSDVGYKTRLFGRDSQELGGTTNAQGKMCRGVGFGGFVHIEMSPTVRQNLQTQESLRKEFHQCVY